MKFLFAKPARSSVRVINLVSADRLYLAPKVSSRKELTKQGVYDGKAGYVTRGPHSVVLAAWEFENYCRWPLRTLTKVKAKSEKKTDHFEDAQTDGSALAEPVRITLTSVSLRRGLCNFDNASVAVRMQRVHTN